jgi:hypothetical protein
MNRVLCKLWLLALAGCSMQMPPHCDTPGGLEVYGGDCAVYSRAETFLPNGQKFWYLEVVDAIRPGWGGETDCALRTTWVLPNMASFFHEQMHIRDLCVTPRCWDDPLWVEPGGYRDQWTHAQAEYEK